MVKLIRYTTAWLKTIKALLVLAKKKANNDGDGDGDGGDGNDPEDRELVREFEPDHGCAGQFMSYEPIEDQEEGPEPDNYSQAVTLPEETFEEMIARAKSLTDNIVESEDRIKFHDDDLLL